MIQETARRLGLGGLALAVATFSVQQAQGYSFNQVVPDVRQPASLSGGSACPVRAHRPTGSGSVAVQWSTAFGTNPVAILTQDQTTSGRLNEIEQAIQQSLGVWTGVSGTTLTPASPAPLARTAVANACGSIMFPSQPAPGTYAGPRPTAQQPDAPLAEDDRTGLRALYPDPNDMVHTGTITGRILSANPLSLLISPPGVTGIFGAQVVAVDALSGAATGGAIGGWSCSGTGPVQFDGTYVMERLAAGGGTSYTIYAEPLNGAVNPAAVSNATSSLCRNAMTDAGWPAAASCIVPPVDTSFTTHMRPSS